MRRRTGAIGTLIALAAIVPMADIAHAQDLDCGDFTYQEDAQTFFDMDRSDPHRLDEDAGPDDGIACERLPRRGLTSSTFRPAPTSRPPTSRPPTSRPPTAAPTRTPTVTASPTRTTAAPTRPPTVTPTASPTRPPSPTPTPTRTSAAPTPTRGVQGGLGGSSAGGPTNWDIGIGATFASGALLATGYVVRRRRT
ncbi:excalibur calcium-binding protein [Streptomyces lusitanus]|uniref:Excalibur calcium-binding protein n=1 Tax=Streptomyces lusitanus TaxID=68232 RepID=A0ABU3K1M7_9ACTN|nr:excalibur calcium-binding protein [Streptomyces lusitanus]